MTRPYSVQAQANEVIQFTTWLSVTFFILWMGKKVGGWEKKIANDLLDVATLKEIPVRLPQTKPVTVTCPICGKPITIGVLERAFHLSRVQLREGQTLGVDL